MGIMYWTYRVKCFGFHGKNKMDVEMLEKLEFSDLGFLPPKSPRTLNIYNSPKVQLAML